MSFHHEPEAVAVGAAVGGMNAIGSVFSRFGLQ